MTAYKPLVEAVAAASGELLTSLSFSKDKIRNYDYGTTDANGKYHAAPWALEHRRELLNDLSEAEQAVRACRDAVNYRGTGKGKGT